MISTKKREEFPIQKMDIQAKYCQPLITRNTTAATRPDEKNTTQNLFQKSYTAKKQYTEVLTGSCRQDQVVRRRVKPEYGPT